MIHDPEQMHDPDAFRAATKALRRWVNHRSVRTEALGAELVFWAAYVHAEARCGACGAVTEVQPAGDAPPAELRHAGHKLFVTAARDGGVRVECVTDTSPPHRMVFDLDAADAAGLAAELGGA